MARIFISYRHTDPDQALAGSLLERLKAAGHHPFMDIEISPGARWAQEIERNLKECELFVVLVSADSAASDMVGKEVSIAHKFNRTTGKPIIIPVRVAFDGDLPYDIGAYLDPVQHISWKAGDDFEGVVAQVISATERFGPVPEQDGKDDDPSRSGERSVPSRKSADATSKTPVSADRISIARLPVTGLDIFGREAELQLLDSAWANANTNVVTFVAWGGVGKTALVNHWLKQRMALDNYRGAERVYAWSFYSQGTSERAASADVFIEQALDWFGDADPKLGLPWDKGERLARLIRQTRTLLTLDGLEPLQHPPGPQEGRLKDAALAALLGELAAGQLGLCVISTREPVGDLIEFESRAVAQHSLEQLSPQAGARLLRARGVKGDEAELEQAAAEYGGHALALTLLGSYLSDVWGGDIGCRIEIESLEEDVRHGRHAERVMRAYEKWLGEGAELAVLRLLGLFDRPADAASLAALRAAPGIAGLTDPLQCLTEPQWRQTLAKLRRIRLVAEASAGESGDLDAHPLVREHFRRQLQRDRPEAWREASNRLYEHLKGATKEFPETVEEVSPLYAAVLHGCAGGQASGGAGRRLLAADSERWGKVQLEEPRGVRRRSGGASRLL
jgi:hypothetical protein